MLGLGFVDTPQRAFFAAGLAVFVGWATTALCLSLLLVLGVEPTLRNAALVWLVVGVAAAVAARRRLVGTIAWTPLRETKPAGKILALGGAAVLIGYLAALLVRSWEPTGVLHADVWNQWLAKAKILYFFGGLDAGTGGFTSQFNPDYPLLAPTTEALVFSAQGGADTLELARLHWALAAAFLLGVAWLLAPRVRPAILWPSLAMLALAPKFGALVGSSLADEPLALLLGLAGLTTLIWLVEGDPRWAALSGLALAAATATKNEGLMLSLVMVVALAATRRGRRHPRVLLSLAGAIVAVHGVWRVWLNRHSVPRNPFYDLDDVFDPGYLLGRTDRLEYALGQLLGEVATPSRWLLLVPATLVLALLAARRAPDVALFVGVVVVLDVLGFATVYWLSGVDLHFYVDNTVDRLPAFIAVFCGVVFPVLLGVTDPSRSPPRTAPSR